MSSHSLNDWARPWFPPAPECPPHQRVETELGWECAKCGTDLSDPALPCPWHGAGEICVECDPETAWK